MRFVPRLWRPAFVCRLLCLLFVTLAVSGPAAWAATLSGRIVDPDGRAVRSARVVVANGLGTVAEAISDADGRFDIPALAGGRYDVRVVADGLQAEPSELTLADADTRTIELRLRISAIAESIVVSAAQVDVPLSRAADSVTVVTAADLKARQVETVADALRTVPGLAVLRSGGRGAITSLFPRGGSSNYTLVLVDGMRANNFGGGYNFAHLSLADVERIEIVRGPESALFGSDAIGSVVQVVTRRGGAPRVEGAVEGGSQGTSRLVVGASGSHGGWSWGGGAERTASDGYTGVAPATGEHVTNDDYRLAHLSGTLGWQEPGGAEFALNARVDRDERGLPGPFGSNPIGAYTGVDRVTRAVNHVRQVGGKFVNPWTPRVRQRLEATFTDISGDFTSPYGASFTGTRRLDGRLQEDIALTAAWAASAGFAVQQEQGSSTYVTAGANALPVPIRRGTLAAFGELRYVGRERLFVTGGVRLERLTRDAVDASFDLYSPRPAFSSQTIHSLNPKVAASYLLTQPGSRRSTRLRGSAGTGIRPPDAFEIAFTDNPNLQPERSRSVDAGIEQQWASGAYTLSATAFSNTYDNLIVSIGRSMLDASRYRTDNVSNARARGVELVGDARLPAGFTLHVTYTYLDTVTLSVDGLARIAPAPFAVGDPLLRRPRHQGAALLTYARGRVSAFAEVTTRSRTLDLEPSYGAFGGLFFAPGYGVANAGASVHVARGLDVYVRVLNVGDRAYEEALGYPALRRSGIVGLRVAAGK